MQLIYPLTCLQAIQEWLLIMPKACRSTRLGKKPEAILLLMSGYLLRHRRIFTIQAIQMLERILPAQPGNCQLWILFMDNSIALQKLHLVPMPEALIGYY